MSQMHPTQVDQLKSIGADLRQKRQERSISLEEVAIKTYIPLQRLKALEDGQIDRLPEPVFVQGFIRRYGDAIGLDGGAIAKSFSTVLEPEPPIKTASRRSVSSITTATSPQGQFKFKSLYPLVGTVVTVGVAIGLGYWFTQDFLPHLSLQPQALPVPDPSPSLAPVVVSPTPRSIAADCYSSGNH
ncbi:hypothetical protein DO97_15640 [Neosynechococcus sphagnicola sy1]|uniref:HTH cro/C1-type domain-containing protein n=1 Tax=Neosynechococcus sphagnicola sy1 TaxID=1497020 RepID=A0A098TLP7_9CYAN|nr:helix-turn-helix transcriptional regulator [Neosynechococcus sphagnicola]KGF71768.1 hypothetical protein DO97_15640 [Neosynechococcus sphagnicola sy1]